MNTCTTLYTCTVRVLSKVLSYFRTLKVQRCTKVLFRSKIDTVVVLSKVRKYFRTSIKLSDYHTYVYDCTCTCTQYTATQSSTCTAVHVHVLYV